MNKKLLVFSSLLLSGSIAIAGTRNVTGLTSAVGLPLTSLIEFNGSSNRLASGTISLINGRRDVTMTASFKDVMTDYSEDVEFPLVTEANISLQITGSGTTEPAVDGDGTSSRVRITGSQVINGKSYTIAATDGVLTVRTSAPQAKLDFVMPANAVRWLPTLYTLISPVSAETGIQGDTNNDCRVDLQDLNNVRNNFGKTGVNVLGDTNADRVVDLNDLNSVRNNFGKVCFR
jgi:hypothetical protein